jgi:murein DD-endopeptidase MepM/ murein hydrolase activator NlpD
MVENISEPRWLKNPLAIAYGLLFCALTVALWNFVTYYHLSRTIDLVATRGASKQVALRASETGAAQKAGNKANFLLVNRSPQHLQQAAIQFARSHNLARSVRALYQKSAAITQAPETPPAIPATRNKKQRAKKMAREKQLSQTPQYRTAIARLRLQGEAPQFHYPLPHGHFWRSSPFGPRKTARGAPGFHYGIDLAAVRGTIVRASAGGVVMQACFSGGYGNTVVIAHDKKFKTRYAHLAKILVSAGDEVQAGEPIGRVGSTGHVRRTRGKDPSHLHFEVEVYGKRMNPLYFLSIGR